MPPAASVGSRPRKYWRIRNDPTAQTMSSIEVCTSRRKLNTPRRNTGGSTISANR
jgi:hypothetical protein